MNGGDQHRRKIPLPRLAHQRFQFPARFVASTDQRVTVTVLDGVIGAVLRQGSSLSELRKGFQQHGSIQITHTKPPSREEKIGIYFQRFFEIVNGLVVLAQHKVRQSYRAVNGRREGIELARLLRGFKRFLQSALWYQARHAVALVSGRAVRVQFHGARKFRFRTSPVPVVNCEYATQRHVRLGQRIIELQRSGGGSPSLGHQLARRLGSTTR